MKGLDMSMDNPNKRSGLKNDVYLELRESIKKLGLEVIAALHRTIHQRKVSTGLKPNKGHSDLFPKFGEKPLSIGRPKNRKAKKRK